MFKTITDSNATAIFRNIKDAAAKELKLLMREAEKLDWSLMLDTDLGQFGLLSADGLIGQYPYMGQDGYQADTATISMVRNLVSLFVEKFQPVSNELERLRRQNDDLRVDLHEAKERSERLDSQLEQTRRAMLEAHNNNSNLQRQLDAAQAELAELKGTSDGDAATTETGETA